MFTQFVGDHPPLVAASNPIVVSFPFKKHLVDKYIYTVYIYIYMSHYLFAQSLLLLKYPIFSLLLWSKLRTYLLGSSFRIPFFASNYSIPNVHWTSSHVVLETSWKRIFFIRCSINQTWLSGISPFSLILFPSYKAINLHGEMFPFIMKSPFFYSYPLVI